MTETPALIEAARAHWNWRGTARPPFAVTPGPGQVSVWDFPRPPALENESREVVIHWGSRLVARTSTAIKVLETAHLPTYYLPWADVDRKLIEEAGGGSVCEWKGPARYWSLVDGDEHLARVGWSYPRPLPGAEKLSTRVAFYAHHLHCEVGGKTVVPQQGAFYGGWITPDLAGPFKGAPGSEGW